jgi:hypothetical protein
MFRSSVTSTGYPLHSPFSPSPPPRASWCAITFQLDSTNGRIDDIQVNFRRDNKAIEGEDRRIINRVTEVRNVDGTYRRERRKSRVGPVLT